MAGLSTAARADEPLPAGWVLAPFPKFERPAVSLPIPGATRTLLAPARIRDGALNPAGRAEFEALGISTEDFARRAGVTASGLLEKIDPELRRDRNKVVEAAILRSEDPRLPGVVFEAGFAAKFERWFGPKMLVSIPSAGLIYVFPSLAGSHSGYGGEVLSAYKNATRPVSLEVFEIGKGVPLRAVGSYQD
jgi:hypothetical protein